MRKKILRNILSSALILGLFASPTPIKKEQSKKISQIHLQDYFYKLEEIKYTCDSIVHNTLEYWQTPEETKKLKTGDCEDKAIYLYDFLKKKGYNPYLLIGKRDSTSKKYHIWLGIDSKEGNCYVECSKKGRILDVKTLEKGRYVLEYNPYCLEIWKSRKNDLEARAGLKLRIKNFEVQD